MIQIKFKDQNGNYLSEISAEVAETDEEQERGLMNRSFLPENCGMYFPFPFPWYWGFWMKNTLIPLDMLFMDSEFNIIDIHRNIKPGNLKSQYATSPALYGLEVNAGYCDKYDIKVGYNITIKDGRNQN